MNFFHPDSKFSIISNIILDYVKLGLLFLLFSIPVVTAGPAAAAVMDVGLRIERQEAPAVYGTFWRSFRRNFKQAFVMGLLFLLFVCLLLADWYYLVTMEGTLAVRAAEIVCIVLAIFVLLAALYVFPQIARYELSDRALIHNAVIYIFLNFGRNMLAVLILAAGIFLYLYATPIVPVVVCALPGFMIYYMSGLCTKTFRKAEECLDTDQNRNKEGEQEENYGNSHV